MDVKVLGEVRAGANGNLNLGSCQGRKGKVCYGIGIRWSEVEELNLNAGLRNSWTRNTLQYGTPWTDETVKPDRVNLTCEWMWRGGCWRYARGYGNSRFGPAAPESMDVVRYWDALSQWSDDGCSSPRLGKGLKWTEAWTSVLARVNSGKV